MGSTVENESAFKCPPFTRPSLALTGAGDFPVSALTDAHVLLQVDLYPAAVSPVAERDLSKDHRRTSTKNQTIHSRRPEDGGM